MTKHEIKYIQDRMAVLEGQQLIRVVRCGSMATFCFGPMIETMGYKRNAQKQLERDEEGNFKKVPILAPKHALHVECNFRVSCDSHVILAKGDLYELKDELANDPNFEPDEFDYDIVGNNRFEDLAKKYFSDEGMEFFVEQISVNKLGDLEIALTHDFVLEIRIDISGSEECWRFFDEDVENSPDLKHLVVLGNGIEEEVPNP